MARWSLRTKLVAAVAIALLPVLALSGWRAHDDTLKAKNRRAAAMAAAVELAVARHRELMEGSRRLLIAACSEEAVRKSADPSATPGDLDRCETYLSRLLQKFPAEYSAALVTDEAGIARCASVPSAVGMGLADREIFRQVRDVKDFTVGSYIASRVTPRTIIPMAVPIMADGRFRGMCALGISLRSFADLATPSKTAEQVAVVLVDRDGAPVGGNPALASALPAATRVAVAIAAQQIMFTDYGRNGSLYEFHVLPLSTNAIFAVAAVQVPEGLSSFLADWGEFTLIVLLLVVALVAVWLGADRWCVRPLHSIREFAGKVARGEASDEGAFRASTPELAAVAESFRELASSIAKHESSLTVGLEQRDHLLREIHHRVKNNLQMISSLLNLQAGEIRSPRIRRFFGDAQNRVLTLSILHRHLYERSSWSLVDFQQFISDLVRQIAVADPGAKRAPPRYHIRAPIMAVGPDTAIPVGLIVTEAVSSALTHDFGAVAVPEIRIETKEMDDQLVELVIEDNGIDARPESKGPNGRGGFGWTLVRGLAMQLGGEAMISARDGGGTRVVVVFPLPKDGESDG
jgi:two-component sensor histidine kinase